MVIAADIDRIDEALKANNELTSYRFVQRLNTHIYSPGWGDAMREELQALCSAVTPRFPIKMPKNMRSTPGFDHTGRSHAGDNADDAFRDARRNLIAAIVEYEERLHVEHPRNPMEIMRDKSAAEQQLAAFLSFTGFMGKEMAREHVRAFERLVKAKIGAAVGAGVAGR